jgi:cation/acetate symporter
LLLGGASFMAFMVLLQFGFSPEAMFAKAIEIKTALAAKPLIAEALKGGMDQAAAEAAAATKAAAAGSYALLHCA